MFTLVCIVFLQDVTQDRNEVPEHVVFLVGFEAQLIEKTDAIDGESLQNEISNIWVFALLSVQEPKTLNEIDGFIFHVDK